MRGIVRAGCGFGVILHGDYWQRFVTHTFNAAIVEIDVGDFDLRGQAVRRDCKAMIVRSDFDFAVGGVLHWLVAASMSEDKFKRLAAKRAAQQLVAKTNTKRRHRSLDQISNLFYFAIH